MKNKKEYVIDRGCKLCYGCIWSCPAGAIVMTVAGAKIDQAKCVGCGKCYDNCCAEAIRIVNTAEDKA